MEKVNKSTNDMSGIYIYLFSILFIFGIMFWFTGIPTSIYGSIVNPSIYESCQGVMDMNGSIWRCY